LSIKKDTHSSPMPPDAVPRRAAYAAYGAGLFANGQWDMLGLVVPLYAVLHGLSPLEIGLIVSARSILPTLFSIHGGALMDRFGTRRVLISVAVAMATLPLIYPVSGIFAAMFLLQTLSGLAGSLAMGGTQTLINQLSGGYTTELARFSFVSRVGTFGGPIIIGAVWDLFGAMASFVCIAAWGVCTLGTVLAAPEPEHGGDGEAPGAGPVGGMRSVLPRWSDYARAVTLATIPAVGLVLVLTFLRNGPGAIQATFYVVYLDGIGVTGTMIGVLLGVAELFAAVGSLLAGPAVRLLQPHWVVLTCIAGAVFFIAVTPLIGQVLILLLAAAALRGVAQGLNQPVMFSILSQGAGRSAQGLAVGLRNTVNRLASIILPIVMGAAASLWGIDASFYLTGAILLVLCALLAVLIGRRRHGTV
jgi:MFS family permease